MGVGNILFKYNYSIVMDSFRWDKTTIYNGVGFYARNIPFKYNYSNATKCFRRYRFFWCQTLPSLFPYPHQQITLSKESLRRYVLLINFDELLFLSVMGFCIEVYLPICVSPFAFSICLVVIWHY